MSNLKISSKHEFKDIRDEKINFIALLISNKIDKINRRSKNSWIFHVKNHPKKGGFFVCLLVNFGIEFYVKWSIMMRH